MVQYSFIFDLDLTYVSQAAGAWHVWIEWQGKLKIACQSFHPNDRAMVLLQII